MVDKYREVGRLNGAKCQLGYSIAYSLLRWLFPGNQEACSAHWSQCLSVALKPTTNSSLLSSSLTP